MDKVQAHWQVWREVNHAAEPGGNEAGGWFADLTQELNLTPDQVEKTSAALESSAGTVYSAMREASKTSFR